MKYPDSGVHFSLPLLVARVHSSLKLRCTPSKGTFLLQRFCCGRCAAALLHKTHLHRLPTRALSSLTSFIFALRLLFYHYCSGSVFWTFAISHEAAALSWLLRSPGASERVAWQTCWRRREDLKLGTFKPWFSASFGVELWCKICNDVQTASVRLLYRYSCYHYVPSLQSVLCGCCWRCLFSFFWEVSSFKGRDPWGFAFLFLGICCCVRVYTICTSSSGSLSSAVLHCWTWRSRVRVWYDVYGHLYLLKLLGWSIG